MLLYFLTNLLMVKWEYSGVIEPIPWLRRSGSLRRQAIKSHDMKLTETLWIVNIFVFPGSEMRQPAMSQCRWMMWKANKHVVMFSSTNTTRQGTMIEIWNNMWEMNDGQLCSSIRIHTDSGLTFSVYTSPMFSPSQWNFPGYLIFVLIGFP